MKTAVIFGLVGFALLVLLIGDYLVRRDLKDKKGKMKIVLDAGAYKPLRAHRTDAGLDIRAMDSKTVPAHGSAVFKTGVHVQLPTGTAGVMISKSGLNVKHDITSTGLIDEGYTGEIVVKLHNHGNYDYHVFAGDKISQLVIVPVLYEDVEIVDALDFSDRAGNGFGSSGR